MLLFFPFLSTASFWNNENATTLIKTVAITYTVSPCIEFFVGYATKQFKIKCGKIRTISEYYEVHAGPEYELHFRYAFV